MKNQVKRLSQFVNEDRYAEARVIIEMEADDVLDAYASAFAELAQIAPTARVKEITLDPDEQEVYLVTIEGSEDDCRNISEYYDN
jgi:hypothetical protein